MNRVVPGLTLAVAWLSLLIWGPLWLFSLVMLIGSGIALYEYFRMSNPNLRGLPLLFVCLFSIFPVVVAISGSHPQFSASLMVSLLGLILLSFWRYTCLDQVQHFMGGVALGLWYISFCASHLIWVRLLPQGNGWLVLLSSIIAASDTGAYYAGRTFGQRKLFPQISPKKTVEGAVGGCVAGIAAAFLVNFFLPHPAPWAALLWIALVLVAVGIAGDLTESMIKRACEVKDSGTLLAGHGGLLDRIDSLLLAAPILYYLAFFGFLG